MPTAGRLVAAILFAALFGYASTLAFPNFRLEEEPQPSWFMIINVAVALVLGWRIAGPRAGKGTWSGAISYGLTTMVAIIVVVLFLHGGTRMIEQSLRKVYDGPAEAVVAIFELMFTIGGVVAKPDVLLTLVVGSVLAGLITEWAGRNYS